MVHLDSTSLDTVVSHLEPSASGESVGNIQERESGQDGVENGRASGAVRVSSGFSTGPEPGEILIVSSSLLFSILLLS